MRLPLALLLAVAAAEDRRPPAPALHEIDPTGWGIRPPSGFTPAEGFQGAWKPSPQSGRPGRPLARNALIRVYAAFSEEACKPSCAGEAVPEKSVNRSSVRGRPATSFRCNKEVVHLAMAWQQSDNLIVRLDEGSCIQLALLARSSEARTQSLGAFRRMQATLAPLLPKRAPPAAAEDEAVGKTAPLLR